MREIVRTSKEFKDWLDSIPADVALERHRKYNPWHEPRGFCLGCKALGVYG